MTLEQAIDKLRLELSWIDSTGVVEENAHLGHHNGWKLCRDSIEAVVNELSELSAKPSISTMSAPLDDERADLGI